jgi:hypothetical protein
MEILLTYCLFAALSQKKMFAILQTTLRTINAMQEPITAGQIIDLVITARQSNSGMKLTEYVRDVVAKDATLSARQIARMREYDGFPEDEATVKLIKALPNLVFLDPSSMFSRILLPWDSIELDQDQLVKPSIITIFAGWKPPAGISSRTIAEALANNISAGDRYVFVYPDPMTYQDGEIASKIQVEQWINSLKSKIAGSWHQKIAEDNDGTNDPDSILEEVKKFTAQVDHSIRYIHTSQKTDLWLLLPSPYCVFYNLGLEDKGESSRHGAFLVSGVLLEARENSISTEGWLLTNREQYNRLEVAFLKDFTNWKIQTSDLFGNPSKEHSNETS